MHPYRSMPPHAFWKTGVAEQHPSTIKSLYRKKFEISAKDRIATAGSCFAQHVATHMRARGYRIVDVEPPPPGLSAEERLRFGYRIYSARYGNIYTSRQLLQLLNDSDTLAVRDEDVWEKDGRYYDALRPSVEPNGLASISEAKAHRQQHLRFVRRLLRKIDVFIFTLGLTETWQNISSGTVYPTCPGVIAGRYDDQQFRFKNLDFVEIYRDMVQIRRILKKRNPKLRMLLTVSPVPLTATASGQHVLAATTYSKATLRSVCGSLVQAYADIDYFPSYEMIASPFSRGYFYEPDQRNVTTAGVSSVMRTFFEEHALSGPAESAPAALPDTNRKRAPANAASSQPGESKIVCEERLLEAFAK